MPRRLSVALLGTTCLVAVHFVSFLEGRGLGVVPFPMPGIIAGFFAGILCGGLFFSSRFARAARPASALLLTLASVSLWLVAIVEENAAACYGACLLGGMLLPPLLSRLLSASSTPGFHLGTALAAGDFFWLFLYLLPGPLATETLWCLLLVLQGLGGVMAALCLLGEQHEPELPPPVDTLARETAIYLTLISLIFFLLNAFIDIVFYRVHAEVFHIPAEAHLYIWIVYPLAGLFVDRHGADMRLLLACLGGAVVSPALIAVSEGNVFYWIIYGVALSSRGAALLYLLLVFARIRNRFARPTLIVSIPYLSMLGSFLLAQLFVDSFPGSLHIALWSFLLTAGFSYLSSRIQYALTLSGLIGAPKEDMRREVKPVYGPAEFAFFSDKYGLSAREQDVLRLIMDGCDTVRIGETLHISENTIKTHVRQLLRKTETRNRIALAALFFNEAGGKAEDDEAPRAGGE